MNEPRPPTEEEWDATPQAVKDFFLATIARLEDTIQKQQKTIEQQQKTIERLEARVQELEERLKLNSKNSSKPPSSDITKPKKKRKSPGKRKRGAQEGHEGKTRKLVPVEEVDELVSCIPDKCEHCEHPFVGQQDQEPHRHQVIEIPPVQPVTTEYQRHTLECSECGKRTRGKLPEGVTDSAFGPCVQATGSMCSGVYFIPRRGVVQLMKDFFGVDMSVGSVSRLEKKTSEALAAPVEEARQFVRNSNAANVDETGTRQEKKKAWLWVAVTTFVTVFCISLSRSGDTLKTLLGPDYSGTVTSDRYSAYKRFANEQRQLCWAHLIRDFERWMMRPGKSEDLGALLLRQSELMFEQLHHARDGTLSRHLFAVRVRKIQKEVEDLLSKATKCGHKETEGTARDILRQKEALWTFVKNEKIEPTNNAAERALRPAVIWRKRSFGADSAEGSRFVERMLTVNASLRSQNRNVLEFITAAIQAHRRNDLPPSLLPSPTT